MCSLRVFPLRPITPALPCPRSVSEKLTSYAGSHSPAAGGVCPLTWPLLVRHARVGRHGADHDAHDAHPPHNCAPPLCHQWIRTSGHKRSGLLPNLPLASHRLSSSNTREERVERRVTNISLHKGTALVCSPPIESSAGPLPPCHWVMMRVRYPGEQGGGRPGAVPQHFFYDRYRPVLLRGPRVSS